MCRPHKPGSRRALIGRAASPGDPRKPEIVEGGSRIDGRRQGRTAIADWRFPPAEHVPRGLSHPPLRTRRRGYCLSDGAATSQRCGRVTRFVRGCRTGSNAPSLAGVDPGATKFDSGILIPDRWPAAGPRRCRVNPDSQRFVVRWEQSLARALDKSVGFAREAAREPHRQSVLRAVVTCPHGHFFSRRPPQGVADGAIVGVETWLLP
jgi:hypothetical protein